MEHRQILATSPLAETLERDDAKSIICWSRMQTEAGQELNSIIRRKELERLACGGYFFWGIGHAPPRVIPSLSKLQIRVPALFSIMRTKPKAEDVSPDGVLLWRKFIDVDGQTHDLPNGAIVTSRASTAKGQKKTHYALMCRSAEPLVLGDFGPFEPSQYRNFTEANGAVGASQVTALLKKVDGGTSENKYRINLRASLVGSYWVRLFDPVVLSAQMRQHLSSTLPDNVHDWLSFAESLATGQGIQLDDSQSPQLQL